jgi:hypothetical protein
VQQSSNPFLGSAGVGQLDCVRHPETHLTRPTLLPSGGIVALCHFTENCSKPYFGLSHFCLRQRSGINRERKAFIKFPTDLHAQYRGTRTPWLRQGTLTQPGAREWTAKDLHSCLIVLKVHSNKSVGGHYQSG